MISSIYQCNAYKEGNVDIIIMITNKCTTCQLLSIHSEQIRNNTYGTL